jgi:hypothetical protein
MVCARHSGKTAPQPPESPRKHRKRSPVQSLKFIEQLKETGKEAHLKATNTRKCYAGHVKRGREWLAEYFKDKRSSKELPWLSPAHVSGEEDPYTNPAFAYAFDRVPNEFSDKALSLFLTYKGFHQNLGRNSVEGIRVGFKDLWDKACAMVVTCSILATTDAEIIFAVTAATIVENGIGTKSISVGRAIPQSRRRSKMS